MRGLVALCGLACGAVLAQPKLDEEGNPLASAEVELALPAYPKAESLIEFDVGALASHRFFIDVATLNVQTEPEGVVYYALVVKTSGGTTNVSYEGMRCDSGEYRVFATGRSDGSWARTRVNAWRAIENKQINRHHAALSRNFFCASGRVLMTAEEGVDALRRGKHPNAP